MKPDFRSDDYRHVIAHRNRYLPNTPIYDSMPDGWKVVQGATTQPRGTCWVANGSFFKLRKQGRPYRSALMWL